MSGENGRQLVDASAFEGGEEELIEIVVPHAQTGDDLGTMFLRRVKMDVRDKYRDLLNGVGRRKGDSKAARAYLFRRAFVRFEFKNAGLELELKEKQTPADFFITECATVVDAVIIQYHGESFPDVDARKS